MNFVKAYCSHRSPERNNSFVKQTRVAASELRVYYNLENISILRVLETAGYITINNIDSIKKIIIVSVTSQHPFYAHQVNSTSNVDLITPGSDYGFIIKKISNSGRRIYRNYSYLSPAGMSPNKQGLGDYVVRTSKGIKLHKNLINTPRNGGSIGGEILFSVYGRRSV